MSNIGFDPAEAIRQLRGMSAQALQESEYERAQRLIDVVKKLKQWDSDGQPGAPPDEVYDLLSITRPAPEPSLPVLATAGSSAPAAAVPGSPAPDSARTSHLAEELSRLQAPLEAQRKDVREVVQAYARVQELLGSDREVLGAVGLLAAFEEACRKLGELQDRMSHAVDGAAAWERAGDFSRTAAQYQAALAAGYGVVTDEEGNQVGVDAALARAQRSGQVKTKAEELLAQADEALRKDEFQAAVNSLEEAVSLVGQIHVGGEGLFARVKTALDQARAALHADEPEPDLLVQVEIAKGKAASGFFRDALDLLEKIDGQTHSGQLRSKIQQERQTINSQWEMRRDELVQKAKRVDVSQRGDSAAQRDAWTKVQNWDSGNSEAKQRLAEIEQAGQLMLLRVELRDLQRPLRMARKDLKEVEAARNRAKQIVTTDFDLLSSDAELKQEFDKTFEDLNALRDDILTTSEGGASSVRAQAYERAIEKFSAALAKGYDVIQDDTGKEGDVIDVGTALRKTRELYWADLKSRVAQRMADAQKCIRDGYPATAIDWLVQAQALAAKIEEGGGKVQQEVADKLAQAREEQTNEIDAGRLISEAKNAPDPEDATTKLEVARRKYGKHPHLAAEIASAQQRLAGKVTRAIESDLNTARVLVARAFQHDEARAAIDLYEQARTLCNDARQRGANLTTTVEVRTRLQEAENRLAEARARLQEAENKSAEAPQSTRDRNEEQSAKLSEEQGAMQVAALTMEIQTLQAWEAQLMEVDKKRDEALSYINNVIAKSEADHGRLLQALAKIDAALDKKDVRLSTLLLEELRQDRAFGEWDGNQLVCKDRRIADRDRRMTFLQSDDKKYASAERLFYEGSYAAVVTACEQLDESVDFRDKARLLRRRAQARLWLANGREAFKAGRLTSTTAEDEKELGAIDLFGRIEALKADLPEDLPEDRKLCDEAAAERAKAEAARQIAAEKRQKLNELKQIRRQSEVHWVAWAEGLEALRKAEDTPEWVRAEVNEEYNAGVAEWRQAARTEAAKLKLSEDWARAYDKLQPLVSRSLLPEHDPDWRRIQYQYLRRQAEALVESPDEKERTQAEAMAQQARNVAPQERLVEAQQLYATIVRRSTLNTAQMFATATNPGPAGAVTYLGDRLEDVPFLKSDAHVRSRIIRYCLDADNHDLAASHAATMRYVPDEEKNGELWAQHVKAARDFDRNQRVEAVAALVQARAAFEESAPGTSGGASDLLKGLHDHIVRDMLQQLRKVGRQPAGSVSEDQLVSRIQALDLIRQLDPTDADAEAELRQLSDRLGLLIKPLRERAENMTLGASLRQSLQNATELLNELQSVVRTQKATNAIANVSRTLDASITDLTARVENWRAAVNALDGLEQQWGPAVGGSWATDKLSDLLDKVGQPGDTEESRYWNGRVTALKDNLRTKGQHKGLRELLRDLDEAWKTEQFDAIIELTTQIEARVRDIRIAIDDQRFVIPGNQLNLLDIFDPESPRGLDELRKRALAKKENLAAWQQWSAAAGAVGGQVQQIWTGIEGQIHATPPCLSIPLQQVGQYQALLDKFKESVQAQPAAPVSAAAKALADLWPKDNVIKAIEGKKKEGDAKKLDIEERLKETEKPIADLNRFAGLDSTTRERNPLSNPRNRERLRGFIAKVREKDACNPVIQTYEDLLRRLEGASK